MFLLKKILIICKWKILRHLTKRRKISFRKMMVRMHYIQQLTLLKKYDKNKLAKFSYNKLRKIFISEYPNEYIHNPKKI